MGIEVRLTIWGPFSTPNIPGDQLPIDLIDMLISQSEP